MVVGSNLTEEPICQRFLLTVTHLYMIIEEAERIKITKEVNTDVY
jgi:hypothetical protein